ncbi:MAG: oligosaccharide flippase family protein [Clostridiales bacterium]|nr:oligosaccharide flippase family protein [Clostridiales bacterium]
MMNAKERVVKNSFLYVFSSILMKGFGFLLMPIYTFFLTPEDYGTINLLNGFINVMVFIVALSLYAAIIRFYVDYKKDHRKLKRFHGSVFSFILISGTVFLTLSLLFRSLLQTLFFDNMTFFPLVFIALLSITFLAIHTMHYNVLMAMQNGPKAVTVNIIFFLAQASMNIVFIAVFNLGAMGIMLVQLILNVIYFAFVIFDLKKYDLIEFCLDYKILKEVLKYSVPILPHNLSTRIASLISNIFLNSSNSLALVGIYSVSLQFGTLIDTIQVAVNKAFKPWFFEMLGDQSESNKNEIVNLTKVLLVCYSIIYMIIGLFSQDVILLLINDQYVTAWTIIPIFVFGFSIKSLYYFYVNILFYYKEASKKIFIATITGSLSNIFLAAILIPLYGMYGGAISFAVSKVITVIIVVMITKKYPFDGYKVYDMVKVILTSMLFLLLGLIFSYSKYDTVFNISNFLYKFFILAVYLVLSYIWYKPLIKSFLTIAWIKNNLRNKSE